MSVTFTPATKTQAKLRLGLIGPAGSGKTWTALAIATALGQRIALIDTEHGSASKYAGEPFTFDTLLLTSFHPDRYIEAIRAAEQAGYDVLIIDGISPAWAGKDGVLELKDRASARQGENSFTAWRHATPPHNAFVEGILSARCHVICTMRSKTEYVLEARDGKQVPRKVGMAPIQRDGMEYEFDVVADLSLDHDMIISKTRCPALDGQVIRNPGADVAEILNAWLSDGTPPPPGPSVELVAEIDGLLGLINGGAESARSHVERLYGTKDVSRLTEAQATELRDRLVARAAEDAGQGTIFKAPDVKPRGRKPNPETGK